MALAGGEVGLVHGLHVGLGVGGRAAPRLGGAGPAAEQRGVNGLTTPNYPGLFKRQWLSA